MHSITVQPSSEAKLVHAVYMSQKDQATRFRQRGVTPAYHCHISGPAYSMAFTFRVWWQSSCEFPTAAQGCVPKGDPLRLRLHDHPLL